jgi:hypothetical protein
MVFISERKEGTRKDDEEAIMMIIIIIIMFYVAFICRLDNI